jgi:hypothetical protein
LRIEERLDRCGAQGADQLVLQIVDRRPEAQMRRFLQSGSRRNLRALTSTGTGD